MRPDGACCHRPFQSHSVNILLKLGTSYRQLSSEWCNVCNACNVRNAGVGCISQPSWICLGMDIVPPTDHAWGPGDTDIYLVLHPALSVRTPASGRLSLHIPLTIRDLVYIEWDALPSILGGSSIFMLWGRMVISSTHFLGVWIIAKAFFRVLICNLAGYVFSRRNQRFHTKLPSKINALNVG